jgi:hypothetical protein
MKSKLSPPLTWDQLANEHDAVFGGRPARTLPMDRVFEKVSKLEGFKVNKKEGTIHKIIKKAKK